MDRGVASYDHVPDDQGAGEEGVEGAPARGLFRTDEAVVVVRDDDVAEDEPGVELTINWKQVSP